MSRCSPCGTRLHQLCVRVFEDGEDDEIDKYDIQVCLNYHESEIKGRCIGNLPVFYH